MAKSRLESHIIDTAPQLSITSRLSSSLKLPKKKKKSCKHFTKINDKLKVSSPTPSVCTALEQEDLPSGRDGFSTPNHALTRPPSKLTGLLLSHLLGVEVANWSLFSVLAHWVCTGGTTLGWVWSGHPSDPCTEFK